MRKYIVLTSSAAMPASVKSPYRHVAVLLIETDELPPDGRVRMISTHARGVKKIVAKWERCNVGKTERCCYRVCLAKARKMAEELNAKLEATIG